MQFKLLNRVILVLVSLFLIMSAAVQPARMQGDWNEYFLMTISFSNHFSPDLRPADVEEFYGGIDPYRGYFSNGKALYSYHFFAYSLLCSPVYKLLELSGMDVLRTFQITNALLFSFILFFINMSGLSEMKKLFFSQMLIFSPVIWFLRWPHPEIFIITMTTISLIYLHKKDYTKAFIFASVASWQNQILIPYVFYVFSKKLDSKIVWLPFVPNIFYLLSFRTLSLLTRETLVSNLSLFRVWELFFDLNIGLINYIPVLLILFIYIIYKRKEGLSLVMVACMLISSMTSNWNHGTSGPSRYALLMLPFIFYIIVKNLRKEYEIAVMSGIILQLIILMSWGGLAPDISYTQHTPQAAYVLDNFPGLYNPTKEIFCERTKGADIGCRLPVIYKDDGRCRKAVADCGTVDEIEKQCGRAFAHCDGMMYINY